MVEFGRTTRFKIMSDNLVAEERVKRGVGPIAASQWSGATKRRRTTLHFR
jgi:hypothetical protein